MAKKETKRKAFNFLRSYFDVLNELDKDKDRLEFLLAIINKQFLNEDPVDLNFVSNLCYESQRHQIETSVKGYEDKTGNKLGESSELKGALIGPSQGGEQGPSVQEEEKEEEEEKGQVQQVFVHRSFDHLSLSIEEHKNLVNEFGSAEVEEILDQIENFKGNKKYKSLYLTVKNWIKKKKTTNQNEKRTTNTPRRDKVINDFFRIPGE